MKPTHFWLVAGTVIASLSLAACEDDPYYHHHHRDVAYADDAGYDVWYDHSYGDVYDGYWGDDNMYYYRSARDQPFVRDDAHHFRRDRADGFATVHMHDWRNRH